MDEGTYGGSFEMYEIVWIRKTGCIWECKKSKICLKVTICVHRPQRSRILRVMLCYVAGSRRLMSPDPLQPKAYCANPGL